MKETKILHGQGKLEKTKEGAMRESSKGRGRFDLLPYEAMEALAIWFELGALKYEERNWEKGLSVKDTINRMVRHSLKAASGFTDEDHLAAVMWNAAVAITMLQRRPDCNDHCWTGECSQPMVEVRALESETEPGPVLYSNTILGLPEDLVELLYYQGKWDLASGSTPTNSFRKRGYYWIISHWGNSGNDKYEVGDWMVWTGKEFIKVFAKDTNILKHQTKDMEVEDESPR